ncbi:MAG: endonuclease domain-containing protein [Alphaproteobacteria bacterium]|nr:MAG: endonuclease domain-containing protein [Alphaproteobacteria bacterium]
MTKRTTRARTLRRNSTEAETILWQVIRNNHAGAKFRCHVPVGPYIADFLCHDLKLIVEVDGGQHCENEKDEIRTKYLNKLGFKVIRFWNNDVVDNPEDIASTLTHAGPR